MWGGWTRSTGFGVRGLELEFWFYLGDQEKSLNLQSLSFLIYKMRTILLTSQRGGIIHSFSDKLVMKTDPSYTPPCTLAWCWGSKYETRESLLGLGRSGKASQRPWF